MKSSSYLFLNGIRQHYIRWNDYEDGQPVILLHGLAYTARTWDFMAPELAKKGWSPLAPDLRGHGLSDKPEGEYGFGVHVRDLAVFIDTTGAENPILVGHSWGGMVALDYSAQFTLGPRAPAGLVLVDGGIGQLSDIPGATWEKVRDFLAPVDLSGQPVEALQRRLLRPNSTWTLKEELLPSLLANYEIDEDELVYPRLDQTRHIQILQDIWEFNSCQRYSRLRCPVLMIPTRPKEPLDGFARLRNEYRLRGIEQARATIRSLQVHWMLDTIHDVPFQRPQELAALIDQFAKSIYEKTREF